MGLRARCVVVACWGLRHPRGGRALGMKVCPTCKRESLEGDTCPYDGAQLVRKNTDQLIGRIIKGRYKIEARVGVGGMGAVYRATDTKDKSTVAVKVLLTRVGPQAQEHAARFMREAEILEQL